MSQNTEEEIACPNCGTVKRILIWHSLNVSLDPAAKDELLAGRINLFECNNCGTNGHIPVMFLYHDVKQQFCVQYVPAEGIDDPDVLSGFGLDGTLSQEEYGDLGLPDYMRRQHVVFDFAELVRYVAFRDNLGRYWRSKPRGPASIPQAEPKKKKWGLF